MSSQKEDYLEVDPPVPGQNYVCLSFVSPEEMVRKKTIFECHRFFENLMEKVRNNEMSLEQARDSCNINGFLDYSVNHEEANTKDFNEQNEFRTSMRGLKVRGVYESMKEAQRRAKVLQTRDPTFHVFVGQVGYWLPWDPNPDNIENQEYSEQTLNTIVKKYKENKQAKDQVWEEETRKRIEMAKSQNNTVSSLGSSSENTENQPEKENVKTIFEGEDIFLSRKSSDKKE